MLQTIAAGPGDQSFLCTLYCSTRQDEVGAWGWDAAAAQAFLQMQWRAQSAAYASQYPGAEHRIILVDGQQAGRLLVHQTEEAVRLVDIALLPAFRGQGVGVQLLGELQAEAAAAGKPVRLSVFRGSPARRLYKRLGFQPAGGNEVYEQMEWRPV